MSIFNLQDDFDWRADAACLGVSPDTFFPEPGPDLMQQYKEARQICAGCPVRAECLEDALALADHFGIRAGLGEKERRKIATARGLTAPRANPEHGTAAGYRQHYRLRQKPCEPCRQAEANDKRHRRGAA